jgi:hypothetical protein
MKANSEKIKQLAANNSSAIYSVTSCFESIDISILALEESLSNLKQK